MCRFCPICSDYLVVLFACTNAASAAWKNAAVSKADGKQVAGVETGWIAVEAKRTTLAGQDIAVADGLIGLAEHSLGDDLPGSVANGDLSERIER